MKLQRRLSRLGVLARMGVCLATVGLALLVVEGAPAGAQNGSNPGQASDSLTVSISSGALDFGPLFIAQQDGLFAKQGLTVTALVGPAADTVAQVVSGESDLALYTAAVAAQTAAEGQDVKIIYGSEAINDVALVASPSVKTIAAAQALSSCTIATVAPGSIVYADALLYKKNLNLGNCTIAIVPSVATIAAGVQSGLYQLGTVSYATAVTLEPYGVSMLLDPTSASFKATYTPKHEYPEIVMFGLAGNMNSKHYAIVRFLTAYAQAEKLMGTGGASSATLANAVLGNSAFVGQTLPTLTAGFDYLRPYENIGFGGSPGYISSSSWNTELSALSTWGLTNFSNTAPAVQYKNMVDMTYERQIFSATTVHGDAVVGRTVTLSISGPNFYGQTKVTSNEPGTSAVVTRNTDNSLKVRVKVKSGSSIGKHTFTIKLSDGTSVKATYSVKSS